MIAPNEEFENQLSLWLRPLNADDQQLVSAFAPDDLYVFGDGFGFTEYIRRLRYGKATPLTTYRRWQNFAAVLEVDGVVCAGVYYRILNCGHCAVLDYLIVDRQHDLSEEIRVTGLAEMMGLVNPDCPRLYTMICAGDDYWRQFLEVNRFELVARIGAVTKSCEPLKFYVYKENAGSLGGTV